MTRGWLHVGASYAGLRLSDGHVDNKGPEYLSASCTVPGKPVSRSSPRKITFQVPMP
jgi:hypothetical protein